MDKEERKQSSIIEVDVRQEHIDNGNVRKPYETPIVLALNEQHPLPDGFIWAQTSYVSLRLQRVGAGDVVRLQLPPISRGLEGDNPSPVRFPIVLEDKYEWRKWHHEETRQVVDLPFDWLLQDD